VAEVHSPSKPFQRIFIPLEWFFYAKKPNQKGVNQMQITKTQSPNRTIGRQGWHPDHIVCHITEGSFPGTISWITNPSSQIPYHYVVSRDGRIVQAVDLADTAWANGTTTNGANNANHLSHLETVRRRNVNANLYTISIGFEGRHSEKQGDLSPVQLAAGIELIAHIREEVRQRFGVTIPLDRENIVGHSHITPRRKPNCPGQKFPFDEIIRQLSGMTAMPKNPASQNANETIETMRFDMNSGIYYIPAFIRNDLTYVQARPLIEAMGYNAKWDDNSRTVIIR